VGGQPKLRVGGRHHARAADITRARPTSRAVVCVAVNFFPFLKIFLSVFDFSKGKKTFFSKSSQIMV